MADFALGELLSPIDFEHLIRDLLSKDLGVELTSFAEGPDGGIDLRHSMDKEDNQIVIQCKRTSQLSEKNLIKEQLKLESLKLNKYYLASSSDFSVKKTSQILTLFSKWMENESHIYGKSRINQLLDLHDDVLRKHYKLWINSSHLFNVFINNHLIQRAKFLFETIKTDSKYYVKNESYNEAINILKKNNFLVISGIPGIGKTTLARILLSDYAQKGFEIIEIRNVLEGEKILEEGSDSKQVFYFDDFLGENFLQFDVLKGRSNDLMNFVRRINLAKKDKILILTTREYILNQAKERYEKLNNEDFEIAKHILDLGKYTERIRAYILYNHLYYSGIGEEYIENIIKNKTYKTIINHRNYNPRIIERMTVRLRMIEASNYSKEFLNHLENPFIIWSRAFDNEISEGAQVLLYVLLSFDGRVIKEELKTAFKSFTNQPDTVLNGNISHFHKYLKEVEDSFIISNSSKRNSYIIFSFQNPSVKDFLINTLKDNKDVLLQLVKSLFYVNQLRYLINFSRKTLLDQGVIKALSDKIYEIEKIKDNVRIFSGGSAYDWKRSKIEKLSICSELLNLSEENNLREFLVKQVKNISIDEISDRDISTYIELIDKFKTKFKTSKTTIVSNLFNKIEDITTLKGVLNIFKVYPFEAKKYVSENNLHLTSKVENILDESLIKAQDSYDAGDIKDCLEEMDSVDVDLIDDFDHYWFSTEERIAEIFEEELSRGKKQELEKIELLEDEDEVFDADELFKMKNFAF
ncbi:nSTAND3 domain-containing NTPase [Aquimarina sp. 433]